MTGQWCGVRSGRPGSLPESETVSVATGGRLTGVGRVLVAVYAILALAATGRSVVQLATKYADAPVAYLLSAVAALVYILATVALVRQRWYRVAWVTIGFECVGVFVVGALSVFDARLFPDDTVWSWFGRGYVWVPLVLPCLGMWWLSRHRPTPTAEVEGTQ